jgi:ureidoacrylate peracid hydrolase
METAKAVTIEARPGDFELDPSRATVIVVDMQNDFSSEQGLFGLGGVPLAPIHAVVEPTARVLAAGRRAGIPIVYIKTGFVDETTDLPLVLTRHPRQTHACEAIGKAIEAPDGSSSRVLIRDTWNTDVIDELEPAAEDRIVWKTRYSGFFETELEDLLNELGSRDLVFTGCTTSVCVDATVKDAMFRDFNCLLLEDCVAEPIGANLERTNHDATVLATETLLGWVSNSTAVIEALASAAASSREPAVSP